MQNDSKITCKDLFKSQHRKQVSEKQKEVKK
jgi:hypothetical protein